MILLTSGYEVLVAKVFSCIGYQLCSFSMFNWTTNMVLCWQTFRSL